MATYLRLVAELERVKAEGRCGYFGATFRVAIHDAERRATMRLAELAIHRSEFRGLDRRSAGAGGRDDSQFGITGFESFRADDQTEYRVGRQ